MNTGDKSRAALPRLAIGGLAILLAACGGSGGGGSSSPTPTSGTGTMNLAITDGPSDNFSHVWVTITEIALHQSQDQVWDRTDATWQQFPISPTTVDLTTLNNGVLDKLLAGVTLPVGTYRQIRFFFAGADDALTTSAQSTMDSNGTPLQYNDQVEYTNTNNGSGTLLEAPLEVAAPVQGIQLVGTFQVATNSPLNLAVDFDLDKDIVPFRDEGITAFALRPNLRYFDLDNAGAITGSVDTAALCHSAAAPTSSCAYNLVIKAERLSADGSRYFVQRATSVKSDGTFTLFPLPVQNGSGHPMKYDVLIRGRNMETTIVQQVPVTAGSAGSDVAINPTAIQSGPLPITINAGEYYAQFATPLQPLTSGWALFQETLPNSVPYEVRWDSTEPFTGLLYNNLLTSSGIALSPGPLHVAAFNNGLALTFNDVTPSEGLGGYSVATNANAYYTLSSNTTLLAPSSGSTQTFTPPVPTIAAGVEPGTLSGSIVATNREGYDHGQLVVQHFGNIITSTDISTALQTGSGTYTIAGLPAGSASAPVAGAYYFAYVRLWNTTAVPHQKHARIIPVSGMIDLRKTSTASGFNVTIP